MNRHHDIVIIGGGTGGLTVASQLAQLDPAPDVAIIEPSTKHYYQPLWTLVGAGVYPRAASEREEAEFIPEGQSWIRERVVAFEPEHRAVVLAGGGRVTYSVLIVAAGIQLDWDRIAGLRETLGKNGVTSNYSWDHVEYTWDTIRTFRGGKALFTFPNTPIKCAGAPQKIMYLAEHAFRRQGVRERSEVAYWCAGAAIFGVARYRAVLEKIVAERGIRPHYRQELVAVDGPGKTATFASLDGGPQKVVPFDMIHVTPPMSAPDFIEESPLAGAGGWVEVDAFTLQHERFPEVFSLGDCSSLPCSKTGAAIRKQAPVLVANVQALRDGRPLTAKYDGYASCPLVTGYGTAVLAEFKYDGVPAETFPFSQARERYSMYALKAYGLPQMYWHGMLRGRM
ncbi:MAG: FAD/NAD(P)-binding oxidoreductase [bacterium]